MEASRSHRTCTAACSAASAWSATQTTQTSSSSQCMPGRAALRRGTTSPLRRAASTTRSTASIHASGRGCISNLRSKRLMAPTTLSSQRRTSRCSPKAGYECSHAISTIAHRRRIGHLGVMRWNRSSRHQIEAAGGSTSMDMRRDACHSITLPCTDSSYKLRTPIRCCSATCSICEIEGMHRKCVKRCRAASPRCTF